MSNQKIRSAWSAAKKSAKRELGLFVFMMVFGLCVVAVALPVIYLASFLPDWTWWIWVAACLAWFLFGETISVAVQAYREERP